MYTYQDLVKVGEDTQRRIDFVHGVINQHKQTAMYKTAVIADEYARHRNTTITNYRKLLYTISGQAVPDNWSANYKIPSNFFFRFITQQTQFLLGNGVTWQNDGTAAKLGDDFDIQLQKAGKEALKCGVSFGFYNLDHVEVFSLLEFAPLYDEENGALMAGVRFWQISGNKPLRATLYEPDGYTDYMWQNGKGEVIREKRPYKVTVRFSDADSVTIYDGENYPSFPIVPLWANDAKQSEIVGLRECIDAFDLIRSGYANDLDDVSQIYWTISNAGGMDDIDLAQFVQRIKTVKAAAVQDGQKAEAHTVEIPYQSRTELLNDLRRDMYEDFMALDVRDIASGAVTATQIEAAYEPLNSKADAWEYYVTSFVKKILAIAGIDDNPTYTRSIMVNRSEEITNVIAGAEFTGAEYAAEKILTILGDGDRVKEILERMDADELNRGFIPQQEGDDVIA